LAWVNTINGGQDVYYTHINQAIPLGTKDFADNMSKVAIYPNPFDEKTTIIFEVKNKEHVIIDVFDLLGRKINTLLNKEVIGKQNIIWTGTNYKGHKLNAGIYLISIQTESGALAFKVIIQ